MMTLSKAKQHLLGDTLIVIRQHPVVEEELEMHCLLRIKFGFEIQWSVTTLSVRGDRVILTQSDF